MQSIYDPVVGQLRYHRAPLASPEALVVASHHACAAICPTHLTAAPLGKLHGSESRAVSYTATSRPPVRALSMS
jgi:hypothetical protein